MPGEKPTEHLTTETLLDYFDRKLSERKEEQTERHIAVCDECTRRARRVRELSGAWNQWTAANHAAASKKLANRRDKPEKANRAQIKQFSGGKKRRA